MKLNIPGWAQGLEYSVKGSGDKNYTVTVTHRGLTCNCTGMKYRRKCRHSDSIARRWNSVMSWDFDKEFRA